MKFKLLIFIFFTFYVLRFTSCVSAQHFSSTDYIIDFGNFNITSGHKNSANYSLTDTVGQLAPGQYNNTGYIVKAGFQYIYDLFNQFTFSINNLSLSLGDLVPNIGSTATNIISISTPSGHGYQIMVQQNHSLTQGNGITIPSTACDSGPCTTTTSAPWTLASTYGFGFNVIGINSSGVVTGVGTSNYFTNSTYFRPFSTAPISQIAMSENNSTSGANSLRQARVTYKANVSAIQAAGRYENGIIFTAVPKY